MYVDPDDGQVVIVDFKIDAITDDAALEERIAAYRGQGESYRATLQQALNLPDPPVWELWFLQQGRTVRP